jgi:hypothetical protein
LNDFCTQVILIVGCDIWSGVGIDVGERVGLKVTNPGVGSAVIVVALTAGKFVGESVGELVGQAMEFFMGSVGIGGNLVGTAGVGGGLVGDAVGGIVSDS